MVSDLSFIFQWWFLLFLFGLVSTPTTTILFRSFTDAGYGFAKTLGTLMVSYAVFLFVILKILPLTLLTMFIFCGIFAFVNGLLFLKKKNLITTTIKARWKFILLQEALFSGGLFLWAYIRGFAPDINGLEKFMDFGFVNAILYGTTLPPEDMWFSNQSINYYWFGHYWIAFLTKLSGLPSSITYNLSLATLLGLSLSTAFSVISTLITDSLQKPKIRKIIAGGIISAILLSFAGNFHTPFFGLKEGFDTYWYPDATRFIGYNPETNDKTIHEFPVYSFVVSDLHAHLINLPIVLMYLGFVWLAIRTPVKKRFYITPFLGLILGIMFMTSTWDFGNYLIFTGFAFLFTNLWSFKLSQALWQTMLDVGSALTVSVVAALAFILHFESIAQGIKLTYSHTPLWQLAILWGFPAVLTLLFISRITSSRKEIIKTDLFVLAMFATGWVLIIIPEVFYVKDIYIASHYRANTMFKLTYQAFVLFYLSSGYVAMRVLNLTKNMFIKGILFALFILLFSGVMTYPSKAIGSYYNELEEYQGLDGALWLKKSQPDLYNIVTWLKNNAAEKSVILEAAGDSYTEYNVVSSYTGIPTVAGWFVHEWLWRGSADIPQKRVSDIETIFTTTDASEAEQLLNKYDVDYVLIGTLERERYNVSEEKFTTIGHVVFTSNGTSLYQIR